MSALFFNIDSGGTEALAVAAATVELTVMTLAAYTVLRRQERSGPEAAAAAFLLPLMFLSFVFQVAFLAGGPAFTLPAEVLVIGGCLFVLGRRRDDLAVLTTRIWKSVRQNRAAAVGLGLVGAYILLQALVVPPGFRAWDELVSIVLLERQGCVLCTDAAGGGLLFDPLRGSINSSILAHLLLRMGTDRGVGLFGFMAYLSIGFSTYAMARRYAWPPTALTAALVVLSLPRLVVQASGTGQEMVAAAAALLCLLSIYRLVEQPNIVDLLLMGAALLFSISGGALSLTFPTVLAALAAVLLYRRHGVATWWRLAGEHRAAMLAAIAPAIIFSQFWLFVVRRIGWGRPAVSLDALVPNTGGLPGALANLARYGLESADFTLILEHLVRWMFGVSPTGLLERLYAWAVAPALGELGAAAQFQIRWIPDESFSWFGPFGFLFLLPAVAYALWRGPRRIKATALALTVYAYLVALVPAWQPGNARFFSFFFVCGGFCIAFFLPPWRLTTHGKRFVQIASVLLIAYAAALNTSRPVVGYARWLDRLWGPGAVLPSQSALLSPEASIWKRIGSRGWQFAEVRTRLGDDRLDRLAVLTGGGKRVGVFVSRPAWLYPLLRRGDEARIVPVDARVPPEALPASDVRYLLYLDAVPESVLSDPNLRRIWGPEGHGALPGALFLRTRTRASLQAGVSVLTVQPFAPSTNHRRVGSPAGKSRNRFPGFAGESPSGRR